MANVPVAGTRMYSGVTTTTDTDVLTLTGPSPGLYGGGIKYFLVRNNHATATLLVTASGTSPSAVGTNVVKIVGSTAGAGSGATAVIPVQTVGVGTAELRLTGSAACDYYVIGYKEMP
jgi:hypothetical protein